MNSMSIKLSTFYNFSGIYRVMELITIIFTILKLLKAEYKFFKIIFNKNHNVRIGTCYIKLKTFKIALAQLCAS